MKKSPDTPSHHSVDFRNLLGDDRKPIFESTEDIFDQKKLERAVAKAVSEIAGKIDNDFLQKLPRDIFEIFVRIANDQQVSINQVAAEWLVQQGLFLEIVKHFGLGTADEFGSGRPDGFMALTMNGSLLTGTAPAEFSLRDITYTRIPSRKASWQGAVKGRMAISDLDIGRQANFSNRIPGVTDFPTGFLTSPLRQIAVIPAKKMKDFEKITHLTRTGIESTVLRARKVTV